MSPSKKKEQFKESKNRIAKRKAILYSDADRTIFFEALMKPPKVSYKMKKAAANYAMKILE